MTDRVIIYLTADGAGHGVAPAESILVGGIKHGTGAISIDGSNNIFIDGLSATIMSALDMNSHQINNISDPTGPQDAATKHYVDAATGGGFIRSDGSVAFAGDESMGGHKLTSLGSPSISTDAATKGYVDTAASSAQTAAEVYSDAKEALDLRLDGSRPMHGPLDMGTITAGTNPIHFVTDPTSPQDAATKNYVDSQISSGLSVAEADSASDTNGGSDTYIDTGATVTFTLSTSRLVQASAFATANPTGGGSQNVNVQLGLNIGGTDYNGSGASKTSNETIPFNWTVVAKKDIVLAAGSHTITVRYRRYVAGTAAMAISGTHLSVVY